MDLKFEERVEELEVRGLRRFLAQRPFSFHCAR